MMNSDMFELSGTSSDPQGAARPGDSGNRGAGHRARTRYSQNNGVSGENSSPADAGSNQLEPESAPQTGIDRMLNERQAFEAALQVKSEFWREEVVNRVEGYRTRRSRKRLAGQFSMRLDFETPRVRVVVPADTLLPDASQEAPDLPPTPTAEAAPVALAAQQSTAEVELEQPAPSSEMDIGHPLAIDPPDMVAPPEPKIIEFPRFMTFPEFEPDPRALAEPVFDTPRILDVPEAVGLAEASPLADIALAPEGQEEDPVLPAELELPLRVAPFAKRFTSALTDLLLVTLANGIFAMVVAFSALQLPPGKPLLGLELAVPIFFWSVYHYLFLVHAGATPGMLLAGIRLRTFQDATVPRRVRRWRALAMALSLVSLGFGFLWALVDQDTLCWHDKMTGTYLADV